MLSTACHGLKRKTSLLPRESFLSRHGSSSAHFRVDVAEFVAAAGAVDQIPALNGRPEVILRYLPECDRN
ncbi:hypothetical protein R3P38DRAFT_1672734 [Favolaschia claudopus]|uniref:Uncharacterized protein n=1 Tax=Favolaschia claudopus TaxID=2862362 RepID=A0AAW0AEI1_9AGAR